MKRKWSVGIIGAMLLSAGATALGVTTDTTYEAVLASMNNSGVSGSATFVLGSDTLSVSVNATGLEANENHPMHIHGFVGGPASSLSPLDADGDGFIEESESEKAAGGALLSIVTSSQAHPAEESNPALYPMADAGGRIRFSQTYTFNLSDPATAVAWQELQTLNGRVFEIHGLSVPNGPGAHTPGEVNGIGGYKDTLPVAAGMIQLVGGGASPPAGVPEPMSLGLLGLAVVALGMRLRV
jgi:hypothetical protein